MKPSFSYPSQLVLYMMNRIIQVCVKCRTCYFGPCKMSSRTDDGRLSSSVLTVIQTNFGCHLSVFVFSRSEQCPLLSNCDGWGLKTECPGCPLKALALHGSCG